MKTLILPFILILSLSLAKADQADKADPETWAVTPGSYQYSMTITGVLVFDGIESTDMNDKVAVFVGDDCRGVAKPIIYMPSTDRYIAYLMIYSDEPADEEMEIRMHDHSEGVVYGSANPVTFFSNASYGFPDNPYIITNNNPISDILLSNNRVKEKRDSVTVGILSAVDPDDPDSQVEFVYTLENGSGGEDNGYFYIDSNKVMTKRELNFEKKQSYSILVMADDQEGITFKKNFTIKCLDVNDNPTGITLSSESVEENAAVHTVVGILTTEDEDYNDNFEYSLQQVNAYFYGTCFYIEGDELKTARKLDYEEYSRVPVRITTNDGRGGTLQKRFNISIIDTNDPPVSMSLNNNTINENSSNLTLIGELSTTDNDGEDEILTYSFSNEGSTNDNEKFVLDGNTLKSNARFDYEEQVYYTTTIKVTDSEGASLLKSFVIEVKDLNDAPEEISLSSSLVQEHSPIGTKVGEFSTSDPDTREQFTYKFASGVGDKDTNLFRIEGNILYTADNLDYEKQSSYEIRVESEDAKGLKIQKKCIVKLEDINENPTDIILSVNRIDENKPRRTKIGSLTAKDPDTEDRHTYSLPFGKQDNSDFTIEGNELLSNHIFDYESVPEYKVTIKVEDQNGGEFFKDFTVEINDKNDPPSNIKISNDTIEENSPAGTVIGEFQTVDIDNDTNFTYSFTDQISGNDDNGFFTIVDDRLIVDDNLDYETKKYYYLNITAKDEGEKLFTQRFTITLSNVNDAPTGLSLSSTTIEENLPAGSLIGRFTTLDQDRGDTHAYKFINGIGDDDNKYFSIDGDKLKSGSELNTEIKGSYAILVQATDSYGETIDQSFVIEIVDKNDPPTDIILSSNSIVENLPSGSLIGDFATTDPDDAGSNDHTYELVDGEGSAGNQYFTIQENALLSASVFDFEDKASYPIRVKTDDGKGGVFSKQFTIMVIDGNDPPYQIQLTNSQIEENLAIGSGVGEFVTLDQDDEDRHVYELTETGPQNDNQYFVTVGNQLKTAQALDYDEKVFYTVVVNTFDKAGASFTKQFAIEALDANDPPYGLALSNNKVAGNNPPGLLVGKLSAQDPDQNEELTYSFAQGIGGEDNDSFTIEGNQLLTNTEFNLEDKQSYSVLIQVEDKEGAGTTNNFTIEIVNANKPPTDITLSSTSVTELSPIGTIIGTFSTIDPDDKETNLHNYTFIDDTGNNDNENFTIDGNTLKTASIFEFETKNLYSIVVQTDDGKGGVFTKSFTITITDENIVPGKIMISNSSIKENQPVGSVVGTFSTVGQDKEINHFYEFVAEGNNYDNDNFIIDGNVLKTATSFDFEVKVFYIVHVKTTDAKGEIHKRKITITTIDDNDAPTSIELSNNVVGENMPAGTKVGDLSTIDEDNTDTHTYQLAEGVNDDDNVFFQISGHELLTKGPLDYETTGLINVRIESKDENGGKIQRSFQITIKDNNDRPVIEDQEFNVYENAANNTRIGFVSAFDDDLGQEIKYSIKTGNDLNIFAIDPLDGRLIVNTAGLLDYENQNMYVLTVEAKDNDNKQRLSSTAQITINLLDINEAPQIGDYEFSISENANPGDIVGTVQATDVDKNQNISFSFRNTGIDIQKPFTIGAATGEITVHNPELLDYESMPTYQLFVEATDNGNNSMSDTGRVIIHVTDAIEASLNAVNFFSPNNDGINDYWTIQTPSLYEGFELTIFNSGGEIVFNTKNYQNNWDGTMDGKELPVDVYYYVLLSQDGKTTYKGSITLMR